MFRAASPWQALQDLWHITSSCPTSLFPIPLFIWLISKHPFSVQIWCFLVQGAPLHPLKSALEAFTLGWWMYYLHPHLISCFPICTHHWFLKSFGKGWAMSVCFVFLCLVPAIRLMVNKCLFSWNKWMCEWVSEQRWHTLAFWTHLNLQLQNLESPM